MFCKVYVDILIYFLKEKGKNKDFLVYVMEAKFIGNELEDISKFIGKFYGGLLFKLFDICLKLRYSMILF